MEKRIKKKYVYEKGYEEFTIKEAEEMGAFVESAVSDEDVFGADELAEINARIELIDNNTKVRKGTDDE